MSTSILAADMPNDDGRDVDGGTEANLVPNAALVRQANRLEVSACTLAARLEELPASAFTDLQAARLLLRVAKLTNRLQDLADELEELGGALPGGDVEIDLPGALAAAQRVAESLADRVAAQSEVLTMRAEKSQVATVCHTGKGEISDR